MIKSIKNASLRTIIDTYGQYIENMTINHNKIDTKELKSKNKPVQISILDSIETSYNLKISEKIKNLLESDVLKPLEQRNIALQFPIYLSNEYLEIIIDRLFWITIILKYKILDEKTNKYTNKIKELRKEVGNAYVTLVAIMPLNTKEELLNILIFSLTYIIIICIYQYIPQERPLFNNRIILDCFHIVLFELNGVYVSDFYVQNLIEKIFTNRFLTFFKEYGQEKIKIKPNNIENTFLGQKITFPDIETKKDIANFAQEINERLYKDKNYFYTRKPLVKNKKERINTFNSEDLETVKK